MAKFWDNLKYHEDTVKKEKHNILKRFTKRT